MSEVSTARCVPIRKIPEGAVQDHRCDVHPSRQYRRARTDLNPFSTSARKRGKSIEDPTRSRLTPYMLTPRNGVHSHRGSRVATPGRRPHGPPASICDFHSQRQYLDPSISSSGGLQCSNMFIFSQQDLECARRIQRGCQRMAARGIGPAATRVEGFDPCRHDGTDLAVAELERFGQVGQYAAR